MSVNITKLLDRVQRPGRYTGGEHNSVAKEWDDGKIKFALCYPDTYEVGMSNLGLKILYHLLNERPDVLCERVFSPWTDMENALREEGLPLFSIESRRPLSEFDLIGFSLSHELTYTNVLNILHLSNIPLLSKDRTAKNPVIIAGGPAAFNPEPMADFIDIFLIGEGEDALPEIIDAYKTFRKPPASTRRDMLARMSEIQGVYVPLLHVEGKVINKRTVKDLNESYYPTRMIVPYIEIVHDRVPLEIMRGCPHSCRFCQARNIYSPVRIRDKKAVLRLGSETLKNTGYEELSLLSLASNNYPGIYEIMDLFAADFRKKAIGLSVPSLRIEENIDRLPRVIASTKKSGLTFAPESAAERVRAALNKDIEIEQLYRAAGQAYRCGWRRVKLYFMIGLPGEKAGDLREMMRLADEMSCLRKKETGGGRAEISLSVNAFIPKPHTPFQWEGIDDIDTLLDKQALIKGMARSKKIKLSFHEVRMSHLEALLARGDRKLCPVIHRAWQKGAKFDSWKEFFDHRIWDEALIECGVDPSFYTTRERSFDERLPWEHIRAVDSGFLLKEARAARQALFCNA